MLTEIRETQPKPNAAHHTVTRMCPPTFPHLGTGSVGTQLRGVGEIQEKDILMERLYRTEVLDCAGRGSVLSSQSNGMSLLSIVLVVIHTAMILSVHRLHHGKKVPLLGF